MWHHYFFYWFGMVILFWVNQFVPYISQIINFIKDYLDIKQMLKGHKISVVVPCHNEETQIESVVKGIQITLTILLSLTIKVQMKQ